MWLVISKVEPQASRVLAMQLTCARPACGYMALWKPDGDPPEPVPGRPRCPYCGASLRGERIYRPAQLAALEPEIPASPEMEAAAEATAEAVAAMAEEEKGA